MHFNIYTQMDLLLRVPQRTSSSTYLQERHFSVYHSATHSNARLSGLSQTTFVSENLIKSYTNPIKPCGEALIRTGMAILLCFPFDTESLSLTRRNTGCVIPVHNLSQHFLFCLFSKCPATRAVFLFLFILEIREYIHYIGITNLHDLERDNVSGEGFLQVL